MVLIKLRNIIRATFIWYYQAEDFWSSELRSRFHRKYCCWTKDWSWWVSQNRNYKIFYRAQAWNRNNKYTFTTALVALSGPYECLCWWGYICDRDKHSRCWWQLWQCEPRSSARDGQLMMTLGDKAWGLEWSVLVMGPLLLFCDQMLIMMRRTEWRVDINVLQRSVQCIFVRSGITSVLVSKENIFSPKSSISSALNKGWSPGSQSGAGEARRADSTGFREIENFQLKLI